MDRLGSVSTALLLLTIAVLAGPSSASAQDVPRQTRSVDAFTQVALAVPGTLHLRQGETQSVELQAPDEGLDRIESVVEGNQLTIRSGTDDGLSGLFDWLTGDTAHDAPSIDVYVTMPAVEGLTVAGSGDIVAETPIESDDLEVDIAGSGGIDSEVAVTRLTINIAGSGDATLSGRADEVGVEIAGSGDVQASDLEVATAEVSTTGSGDTALHVTDRLSARIVGSGDVRYRGDPTVETSIVGSGNVNPLSE